MRRAIPMAAAWLLLLLGAGGMPATAQNTAPANAPPAKKTELSAGDIAAARASHKVWVNLDTGIYHRGGRWYGKTKNGKFMTLDDAKKAGYKPAKRD